MATIDIPHTTHTIQEIIARELDRFERKESAFNASDRLERAAALGLPLALAGIGSRRDQPNRSPPSTGA